MSHFKKSGCPCRPERRKAAQRACNRWTGYCVTVCVCGFVIAVVGCVVLVVVWLVGF